MSDPAAANELCGVRAFCRCGGTRQLVRAMLFVLAVVLLAPPIGRWGLAVAVPALSPFVAAASVITVHAVPWTAWGGLAVGAVMLLRRRWFCRWVCPPGLLADGATRVGLRLGRRPPRIAPIGPWIVWGTLAGACLGYPVLVWLDPIALYSASFSVLEVPASATAWWSAIGMAAVLLISAAWPGTWCARVCPLGAMQDILGSVPQGIGRASSGSGDRSFGSDPHAPSTGQHTAAPGGRRRESRLVVPRRFILGALAGAAWASAARVLHGKAPRPLRPPGARDEVRFVGLCVRCGNCVRVCPAHIIRPDGAGHGLAGLLAPVLDFRDDYCREDCTRCTEVCPSGALARLAIEDKSTARIGLARVDMDRCLLRDEAECSACRSACPYDAITYAWSEAEYMTTPEIDSEKCPGCGACEQACPTTPSKAIVIEPRSRSSGAVSLARPSGYDS